MSQQKDEKEKQKDEKEKQKDEKEKEEEEAEKFNKYQKSGEIHKEVRKKIESTVKVGMPVIVLCEKIEALIVEKGGKPAFPTNVSINHVAAHYTSPHNDELTIGEKDVVKVDFGVHIEGYIADGAFTVSFDSEYDSLVEAAEKSLEKALGAFKPGVKTNEIGKIIEKTIKGYGYRPIKDLSGHTVDQYMVHGGKVVPNISVPHGHKIEEGEVYGVETFASTGKGAAHETNYCYIYSLLPMRIPVRFEGSRKVIMIARDEYKTLPFTERWLTKRIPPLSLRMGFKELTSKGLLQKYYVLSDIKGSKVAQSEHTAIVVENGIEIITK